jgi:hypothetical protein
VSRIWLRGGRFFSTVVGLMCPPGNNPVSFSMNLKLILRKHWRYVIFFSAFLILIFQTTARLLPRLDEDTRLVPILNNISEGFIAGISSDWANASGSENIDEIKAEMIDELAQKDFPLCMRMHHENLKKDGHLKHFGRLEYGLFLKVGSILDLTNSISKSFSGFGSFCRRSHCILAQVLTSSG